FHLPHEDRLANRRERRRLVGGAANLGPVEQPHLEGSGSAQASHVATTCPPLCVCNLPRSTLVRSLASRLGVMQVRHFHREGGGDPLSPRVHAFACKTVHTTSPDLAPNRLAAGRRWADPIRTARRRSR